MPDREQVGKIAREWVEKAENDLTNAAHTLKLGERCPTDTVCFHAQQCAEKYLKAILVWKEIGFPKTHNISELMALLPVRVRPPLEDREQDNLTEYATVMRYPGDYDPIPISEARKSVASARLVRSFARRVLPGEVLRRKKR